MSQDNTAKKEEYILVIEPYPAIAEVLVTILHFFHYGCSILSNIDRDLPLWRDQHIDTTLSGILLDVDMRSMAALHQPFDVINTFCMQWQHMFFAAPMPPLILLTTHQGHGETLQQAGYNVIIKPFKPSVLINQIRTATTQKPQGG